MLTNPILPNNTSSNTQGGVDMPFGILETLKRPSNQVFQKNMDDSLEGVRYIVSTEPSRLRSVRSWTILIEQWECKTMADIVAHDILFLRIAHGVYDGDYSDVVQDAVMNGQTIPITKQTAFNAVMAAGILINKIDSGRLPDIEKIFNVYGVS